MHVANRHVYFPLTPRDTGRSVKQYYTRFHDIKRWMMVNVLMVLECNPFYSKYMA